MDKRRRLTKKEKQTIKQGVFNMVAFFEKYQQAKTYEDVKEITKQGEVYGKKEWFKRWELLLNRIDKYHPKNKNNM